MSHLWDRLVAAKGRFAHVQSKYRVLFEGPSQPDALADQPFARVGVTR